MFKKGRWFINTITDNNLIIKCEKITIYTCFVSHIFLGMAQIKQMRGEVLTSIQSKRGAEYEKIDKTAVFQIVYS